MFLAALLIAVAPQRVAKDVPTGLCFSKGVAELLEARIWAEFFTGESCQCHEAAAIGHGMHMHTIVRSGHCRHSVLACFGEASLAIGFSDIFVAMGRGHTQLGNSSLVAPR